MRVTMVKKVLESGEDCPKCKEAIKILQEKGLWDRVNKVVAAVVGNEESEGFVLAREYGVERAPFFIIETDDGEKKAIVSVLQFIRELERSAAGG